MVTNEMLGLDERNNLVVLKRVTISLDCNLLVKISDLESVIKEI